MSTANSIYDLQPCPCCGSRVLDILTTKQTYPYLKPLWDRASANFARGAGESVDVFQSGSRGVLLEGGRVTENAVVKIVPDP